MQKLDFSSPLIMGILNVTPDSFFDGGKHQSLYAALKQTEKLLEEGASIIDVGGYSSRPGANHISTEEELKRVIPIVNAINSSFSCAISVDTFRSDVAQASINAGATIINDISGGKLDSEIMKTVADAGSYYVIMHMRGTPQTMNKHAAYKNVVDDVMREIKIQLEKFPGNPHQLIVDPGFGFAKTTDQNFELLKELEKLKQLQHPILVGLSRKSMIYKKLNCSPHEALNGTTALHSIALLKGANILRVHDVKQAVETRNLVVSML